MTPRGRVLMIAHHFPPMGGSGSNRALAFARYLPEYGWEPVVVTPAPRWASPRDDGLLQQLPRGLRVIRTSSLEPRPHQPRQAEYAASSADARAQGLGSADARNQRLGSGDARSHRLVSAEAPNSRFGGVDLARPGSRREDARAAGSRREDAQSAGFLRDDVRPAYSRVVDAATPGFLGADGPSQRARGALRSSMGHLKRFPDAHLGWLPFALAAARNVRYDVAYSSSGPFTSHLVGLLLKRLTHRPWVAELRDGWYRWNRAIFPDYPVWRDALERGLEAAALKYADRVILVTERMAAAFRCQYAGDVPPDHFSVISNGFDRLQFPDPPAGQPPGQHFELLHAGALYYGRSLSTLLEAARRLVASAPDFAQRFSLVLLGTLDPAARAELASSGLGERIKYRGQLDHASTIAAMRAADVLLLVANTTPGAEATVPAKLFEYLAVSRPVLAIAPADSSTADVLVQTACGWFAAAGDPDAIARALQSAFLAHQAGTPRLPNPDQVARFDRQIVTRDLACIFDEVRAGAARRL